MINYKQVNFGCADADTEANRNPELFKEVFYDPHDYLSELISGNRYILRGRKGDGKTAYSAQIRLLSNTSDYCAYHKTLNHFNNLTFEKIKSFDSLGGNPYVPFWKCILMIESVSMLDQFEPNIELEEYVDISYSLMQNGFLSEDDDISITISKLVETNSTINIHSFFAHNRKRQHEKVLSGAEQIYSAIRNAIKNVYLKTKFVFIIDGLDDILYNTEFKSDIITGLIRAVDEINRYFNKTTLSLKIILLVRNDVLSICRDPNLSKLLRDSSINLSWRIQDNAYESELIRLVEKRIAVITKKEDSFLTFFREVFPEKILEKDCLDYLLDNIIYRPRDLLQLFTELQKEFTIGKKLSLEKIQSALAVFSEDYFVEAMKDELTGFFPNEAITILPLILSKLGTRYFYLKDFDEECKQHPEFIHISSEEILEKLFATGYIGQHRPRERIDYTVFSFRNSIEKFNPEHECIIHRGLTRALAI